jgi:hypothetical protein
MVAAMAVCVPWMLSTVPSTAAAVAVELTAVAVSARAVPVAARAVAVWSITTTVAVRLGKVVPVSVVEVAVAVAAIGRGVPDAVAGDSVAPCAGNVRQIRPAKTMRRLIALPIASRRRV